MATPTHRFLSLDPAFPRTQDASAIAKYLLNHYTSPTANHSCDHYRKQGKLTLTWTDPQGERHQPRFTFKDLVTHLQTKRTLATADLDLPPLLCPWLDSSVAITKPDAPIVSTDGTHHLGFQTPIYGPSFPYHPSIDREGVAMNNLQLATQAKIIEEFHDLITGPEHPLDLDSNWLWNFKAFLHNCVSIVEMTLHQLYTMAEYQNTTMGWTFDPAKLGPRVSRPLKDKLHWIGHITGRPLDEDHDVRDFTLLKDLRNHLTHFDPPVFAYTMEDVTGWLNHTASVGRLLWRIREKLDAQLTPGIIQLILLPTVRFVPTDPSAHRVPQSRDTGYGSTQPRS